MKKAVRRVCLRTAFLMRGMGEASRKKDQTLLSTKLLELSKSVFSHAASGRRQVKGGDSRGEAFTLDAAPDGATGAFCLIFARIRGLRWQKLFSLS